MTAWWAYHAGPRCGAWLGPRGHRWLTPTAADWAAGWAAARAAARLGIPSARADARAFARRHAAYHWADRVDVWAMRRGGAGALERWAVVEGELPARGPYLALTLHWGAGMWAHAAFARCHPRTRWLYAPLPVPDDPRQAQLMAIRLQTLSQAMGHPPLPIGGSAAQMVQWWREGGGIMALYDPPHNGRRCVALASSLLGTLYVPAGLFLLAASNRIPVYFYRTRIRPQDGRRQIQVAAPVVAGEVATLVEHAAAWLDESLRVDAAAWHYLAAVELLRTPPATIVSAAASV